MIRKVKLKRSHKNVRKHHVTPEERDFVRFKLELL